MHDEGGAQLRLARIFPNPPRPPEGTCDFYVLISQQLRPAKVIGVERNGKKKNCKLIWIVRKNWKAWAIMEGEELTLIQ